MSDVLRGIRYISYQKETPIRRNKDIQIPNHSFAGDYFYSTQNSFFHFVIL